MSDTSPTVVPIWPGQAPGSEDWPQQEQETDAPPPLGIRVVRNVVHPTLTVYLPDPAIASGAAAVVCPGGAFHFLAIDHEGDAVARWLTVRGIAACVLRYRLLPTDPDDAMFMRRLHQTMADRTRMQALIAELAPLAIADGRQAVRVVRQHAAAWSLAPDRVGILGFSAGGVVTVGAALHGDADSRPSFAAPIYSAPWEIGAVPPDAPPLFIAVASDDPFATSASVPLYLAWQAAGRPAELHIYAAGGHGFGMRRQGLPSDAWIDRFGEWLQGYLWRRG
ncbi:MAG TPA: alpha/beta hydrolase [Roseiflexaceae bacterium]|nr:alpha/beta hydrolase [Roseiflexaceae bacterium]